MQHILPKSRRLIGATCLLNINGPCPYTYHPEILPSVAARSFCTCTDLAPLKVLRLGRGDPGSRSTSVQVGCRAVHTPPENQTPRLVTWYPLNDVDVPVDCDTSHAMLCPRPLSQDSRTSPSSSSERRALFISRSTPSGSMSGLFRFSPGDFDPLVSPLDMPS